MADCECLAKCPFFNDKMMEKPATAQLLKSRYCTGDNSDCARHMVFVAVGAAAVPSDLYPAQTERVEAIIASAR
ncbi:MAG: hypothetical protein JXM71_06040 [Spirochaetales bacterium]|nr:hypothetical protein [Spirochaetales bacterium]